MKLVGVYISPFVRRVAIALNHYGIAFERIEASVVDGRDEIAKYNGLVRVPSLILDDGTVLIDSHQILADLDRQAGPEKSLAPRLEHTLRPYGQMLALLTGALEKMVATFYETRRRPEDKIWPQWAQQCAAQAVGGVLAAERAAPDALIVDGYLFEDRMTHADIAAVLAYGALSDAVPDQVNAEQCPKLSALHGRLAGTPQFADTHPS
jgi:glutathione S-transferase